MVADLKPKFFRFPGTLKFYASKARFNLIYIYNIFLLKEIYNILFYSILRDLLIVVCFLAPFHSKEFFFIFFFRI